MKPKCEHMNIDFCIKKIEISNFRGIKQLEFDFDIDEPTILIGPNNAGKTTFLDALGLALGSGKFMSYTVTDDDFWKDGSGNSVDDFLIKVFFEASDGCILPAVKGGVGDPTDVHGIMVGANKTTLYLDHNLFDSTGDKIMVSAGTPVSKANKEKYQGTGLGGSRRYARLGDIQKNLPEIWYLDPKNLFVSLYEWKTGPLQKLLKLYKEKLFTEEWEVDTTHKMPGSLNTAHKFLAEKALKTPFWNNEVAPKINEKFKEYLGTNNNVDIAPGLNPIDAWIMSQLVISVTPGANLPPVDIKRLGDGWQSIMRLVALEVVAELAPSDKKVLLLIEEPETYLHPHLRRKLRSVLSDLQNNGNQVCIATHSDEMISFAEDLNIVRFTRTNTGTQKHVYSTTTIGQGIKDNERINEHGTHELVFANKVILTEGKCDQFAVKLALISHGVDLDAEGISIIDCHTINNIPAYADMCNKLGIPWFAIHDADMTSATARNPGTQAIITKLTTLKAATDEIQEWDNDLEDVLGHRTIVGSGKATPEWTNTQYGSYTWANFSSDTNLTKFVPIIEKINTWINN